MVEALTTTVHGRRLRVAILPHLPFCVDYGGFELQALETRDALLASGVEACFLNFETPRNEIDILHLFGPNLGALDLINQTTLPIVISALFSGAQPSAPRDTIRHLVDISASALRQRTDCSLRRAALRRASRVVCLNREEATYAEKALGVSPESLVVIPNGVNEPFFEPSPDVFHRRYGLTDFILFVGNITERKNPVLVAQAAQHLCLPAVFIGHPQASETAYAMELDAVVNRSKDMLWIKGLPHDAADLHSAYAAAAVFCLPSAAETQSLSALQSLASRTPTILGDRPYANRAPFENVFRCDPQSVPSIANAILKALDSPPPKALSSAYTWPRVASNLTAVYRSALT